MNKRLKVSVISTSLESLSPYLTRKNEFIPPEEDFCNDKAVNLPEIEVKAPDKGVFSVVFLDLLPLDGFKGISMLLEKLVGKVDGGRN
jgi:hypothetical protein